MTDVKETLSKEEELKAIRTALNVEMQKDDIFCCISKNWWLSWCSYTSQDPEDIKGEKPLINVGGPRPGPINNERLVLDGTTHGEIRKDLTENKDFTWIPKKAWDLLVSWYGGGPYLGRKVVTVGLKQTLRIDMFPQYLTILVVDEDTGEPKEEKKIATFSISDTFKDLLDTYAVKNEKGEKRDSRLWIKAPKTVEKKETGTGGSIRNVLKKLDPRNLFRSNDEDDSSKKNKATTTTAPPAQGAEEKKEELEWRLVPKDHLPQKFENLELASLAEVLIDYKKNDGYWSRQGSGKKNWRDFAVGDVLDCKDTQGKWYESTIRDVKDEKLFVHFDGWPSKWDEWIPKESDRLAPKNTHTTGPYEPNRESSWGSSLYSASEKGKPKQRGAVGLRNLGNTCFMNSTLQCLSNTPVLTDFFVEDKHLAQLNKKNPLGWNGKVAEAYGSLLKELWNGEFRTVAPRQFKETIGQFQPRFSGYQQHDSSELLSFLLDGIHEDCNRVASKPATETVDSKGRPDSIVAREAWKRHLLRNQSIVVDLMQGQLKSRVVCPDCSNDSVTFDPFMFLSVPLPTSDSNIVEVTYVANSDAEKLEVGVPKTYTVKIPKYGTVETLKEALVKQTGADVKELLLAEVWKNKILQEFNNSGPVNFGPQDDIWVWHLPGRSKREGKEKVFMEVQLVNHYMLDTRHYKIFGFPAVLSLPTNKLGAFPILELRQLIRTAISPYLEGGKFKDNEKDTDLYQLEVMDGRVSETRGEIELKDEGNINLTQMAGGAGHSLALGLFWNEQNKSRLRQDFGRARSAGREKARDSVRLDECIDAFVTEETLPKSEAWYCRNCKDHKCARKKFDLWMLPDNLIVHLKRFNYDRHFRDKIETFVDFPTESLDMSKWVVNEDEKKDAIYDLYAVSNHFGGLGGGHYTAYAKNLLDNAWYNLDDSSSTPVDKDSVRTKAAYVLFYSRRKKKNKTYHPKDFESTEK